MRYILLFGFVLHSLLLAATPHLYEAVGDPIYKEVPAVEKLLKVPYLKAYRPQYKAFIKGAKAHQRLGFKYDTKRRKKTLSKAEQQAYLDTLRQLKKQLQAIHLQVRSSLFEIIDKQHNTSFKRLKASKLSVLSQDPKSARAIRQYTKKLNAHQRQKAAQKVKDEKAAKARYRLFLRSADNLNGTWKGKNNEDIPLLAKFEDKRLSLHYLGEKDENIFRGTYAINTQFHFQIKRRKRIVDGNAHIRSVNLKRSYTIKKVTEETLVLVYKDETLTLTRKKKK